MPRTLEFTKNTPGERLWKSFNSIYFSLLYSAPCTLLMTNGSNIYLQICSFNKVNNLIPDYFSFISLGLRMMVNTLLASMKMLWDVLILTMFFICIFALVGMQVFVGVLRNKCAEPVPDNLQTSYIDYVSNSSEWLMSRLLFLFIVHSTLVNLLSVTEYVQWILQTTTVQTPHICITVGWAWTVPESFIVSNTEL